MLFVKCVSSTDFPHLKQNICITQPNENTETAVPEPEITLSLQLQKANSNVYAKPTRYLQ